MTDSGEIEPSGEVPADLRFDLVDMPQEVDVAVRGALTRLNGMQDDEVIAPPDDVSLVAHVTGMSDKALQEARAAELPDFSTVGTRGIVENVHTVADLIILFGGVAGAGKTVLELKDMLWSRYGRKDDPEAELPPEPDESEDDRYRGFVLGEE